MITENLSTLKIHKLTQAQYERELAAGRIDENALYLTPDEEFVEADPTVPAWAKEPNKPTYTAADVGAQPALGFTPVSQGTGTGQSTNKVHIGWATDSTGLKVTVDNTDLGYIYTSAIGKRALSTEGGTMIGEIVATNNNGGFKCDNGTYSIGLRIGASGVSRGIYDDTNGRWILYSDGTTTTKVGGSQDPAQSCLRNIGCGTAALVAGSSTLTTGAIYIQYE